MSIEKLASQAGPCSILDLSLPAKLRMLALGPHPDDFDAIGVTLRFLFHAGHSIDVAVSRTGSGVEDAYHAGLTLTGKAALREEEQRRSLEFFGLPEKRLTFLSLANDAEDQPLDNPANLAAIENLLKSRKPDIVFLPHGNDTNSGHRVMYSLFTRAVGCLDQTVVGWLNRDPKTVAMRTDLYMPFDQDAADWKAELLRFHDSQQQRNLRTRGHGFDERILAVNRSIARELKLQHDYAEAYEIETYNT